MRFSLCLATVLAIQLPCAAKDASTPVGKKVADFTLEDSQGKKYSLGDFSDQKVVVVAFLGVECPLAKIYGQELSKLATKYRSKGVAFVGIDANTQDSLAEIAAYARGLGNKFPVLKDLGNQVADQMGAVRTPEVFVLDQDRVVRYWGRIDDRYGVGYARERVDHEYLKDAIESILADKPVQTASVESVGCYIGRAKEPKSASRVTYHGQIAKIFQERCVECHRAGEIGPFVLDTYDEAAGWADTIAEVVRDERMPPWHASPKHGKFKNDRRLPDAEKKLIYEWVAAGAPKGEPTGTLPPKEFVEGWSLPREPDLVLDIQQEPYRVPATGVVSYQYFFVDPGFTEDKWITASQILPGRSSVVHHVLCFVAPPGGGERGRFLSGDGIGFLSAYVPGYRPSPLPEGMAKYVPAGSKLRFQMHYTPDGQPREDRSKIGFVFADPKDVKYMVQTVSVANPGINIPPHAEDYRREASSPGFKQDLLLLAFSPHMHVRGKSFSYELIYPDGKKRMVLDVPRYDFNWQTNYELDQPMKLPAGTRMKCVAHWDNSENNLANPDPSQRVGWGDQTWDEMMIGFYDVAVPVDQKQLAKGVVPSLESAGTFLEQAKNMFAEMDANRDGKLSPDELPERFARFMVLIDKDHDGAVSEEEILSFIKLMRERPQAVQGIRQLIERNRGGGPTRPDRTRPRSSSRANPRDT